MASDESFKRPGTVPFKWELQPGIPKQQQQQKDAAGDDDDPSATTTPRLALPPAARLGAPPLPPASSSCRRDRRSMSARFATSLAMMPFVTRRTRGERAGAAAAKDAAADFCLMYAENKIAY